MDQQIYRTRYEEYRQAVESFLEKQLSEKPRWADLFEAMRYSLLSGGKRIRPVMTLEFARLAGMSDWRDALPVACSLEFVHTYSLIHDDLPCMDDDDLRRGKPTNHKVYGETLAVLAGDALQPEAYHLILTAPALQPAQRADCALILSEASGSNGMVGGQVLDTLHRSETREDVTLVHRLKTGAMIAGACKLGVAAAGGSADFLKAAEEYGYQVGLAFQIRDDMLDVIGDQDAFGKPIGSDQNEGKVTFVDLLGIEGCENAVLECTEKAKTAVAEYDRDGFLATLADAMAIRKI